MFTSVSTFLRELRKHEKIEAQKTEEEKVPFFKPSKYYPTVMGYFNLLPKELRDMEEV